MKKAAIIQSNYIPWKGYFDIINYVDEFVLLDDVQYTRRDWRNRNKIKTPNGTIWLTIPVATKGKYLQKINETKILDTTWQQKHLRAFQLNYKNCPYYDEVITLLDRLYAKEFSMLSEVNHSFIKGICSYLGITTRISSSSDYEQESDKNERLLSITKQTKSSTYVSGRSANYLDEQLFKEHNIDLCWFDYPIYKEYDQPWGQFIHEVSIIDTLFNCGKSTIKYLQGPVQ